MASGCIWHVMTLPGLELVIRLFFQTSTLVKLFIGKTDGLFTVLPHFQGHSSILNGGTGFILENLATGATSTPWLAIRTPETDRLGTTVPAPINAALAALWVINDLSQTFSSLLFTDVSSGDILE